MKKILPLEQYRVKGITRRWMINILGVIVAVIIIIEIAFTYFIQNQYYNLAKNELSSQISKTAMAMISDMSGDASLFESVAKQSIESFDGRESIELMAINKKGNIFLTTSGFLPANEEMPDYTDSVKNNQISVWQGKLSSGEKVMSISTVFTAGATDEVIGGIRMVISLREINRQIMLTNLIMIFAGLAIIFFVALSGAYFINSIVKPVQEVNQIAREIALGDFDVRIDQEYKDEIGDLCNSINYMASELGQSEKMKNDFISSISHELRTPLTAIKGWGETLRVIGIEDKATFEKGMNVIIDEAGRLTGIVEELLDFSKVQSGRMSMQLHKIDVLTELEDVVFLFMDRSKTDKIRLSLNEPEYLSPIIGDEDRLRQVFMNILDNAFKYSDEGGNVTVSVVEIGNMIHITVADTGIGISQEDLANVKRKFYKANQTRRGSGIGLAIADEIIKLHNGTLTIESQLNIGTTVTISLPVAPLE